MFPAELGPRGRFRNTGRNTGYRARQVYRQRFTCRGYPQACSRPRARARRVLARSHRRSQRPECVHVHSASPPLPLSGRLVFSCRPTGPARAPTEPLRHGPPLRGLLDGLAIRLSSLPAGPGAMWSGVVVTGMDTLILSKSIGRERPQYPVGKSIGFSRRDFRPAPAMPAGEETQPEPLARCGTMRQRMRVIVPILS